MPFFLGYMSKGIMGQRVGMIARQQARHDSLDIISTDYSVIATGLYADEDNSSDAVIPVHAGRLVGKIFTRDSYESINSFPDDSAITKQPTILATQYWGRYAGALLDEADQKITLVRDPMGLSTLFYTILPDGILFASELALIYDCLEQKPDFNDDYFAAYISRGEYAPAATPFQGVYQLQPGMALHYALDGSSSQELLWDMASIKAPQIINPAEFQEQLLETLKKSLKAWVGESKGVCVELSGGLDSSAVMILLREVLRSDQKLIGVNYIDSKEPSANEIPYAQEVADMCGAPLYFIDTQEVSLLEETSPSWRPNNPSTLRMFKKNDDNLKNIMNMHGCDTIVNGQGGDHVFSAPPLQTALADYWLQKGLRGSSAVAQELAAFYRMPLPPLLWQNVKEVGNYYRGTVVGHNELDIAWMADDFARTFKKPCHYLDKATQNFYPAKKVQTEAIAHAVHFAERNQRIAHMIFTHPLLSQPVVEMGLQIPTYLSFADGFDRIFFRKAVSAIKKPQALWRIHKGDTTASMLKKITQQSSAIIDKLENGYLIRRGIIKPGLIQQNMTEVKHGNIMPMGTLISMFTVQQSFDLWKDADKIK